ncbi:MAG: murein biosynthesis integral membrane protein MurJ [Armatimonadota bacterium]
MSEIPASPVEESPGSGVGRAGTIMVASLLLSRVLGLVRDSVISGYYGRSEFTDAYNLAFQIPDILFMLVSGGALSSAFIPVFSEYWHTDRRQEAWKVFSTVLTIMSTVVLLFISVCFVLAVPLTKLVAAGKLTMNPELIPLIARMSQILLPAQFAFFIGGLMMGTLYARKVFSIPGLGPNIYNIGIIFGASVIGHFFGKGVEGICWGATIGAILGNLVVPFVVIRRMGMEFTPSFDTSHEGVRKVFRLMLPVILGLSLPSVFSMIIRYFGSFYPDGTNSTLDYANKLMQAPLGIFGQSLALAVFPVFTQFFTQGRMDLFRKQLDSTMRTVMYLTVPASVLMAMLAPQIVSAFFRHGAFKIEDVPPVALCLRFFCIGIWAWCLHPVIMRAFYSIQDTKTPVIIGTVTTGIFVLIILALRGSMGYLALPLAGSIAPMIMVLMMAVVLTPRIGGIDIKGLAVTLGKAFVGSLSVVAVGLVVANSSLGSLEQGKVPTLLITLGAFLISMWGYYFITKALGMPESAYVERAMGKISRKLEAGSRK